MTIDSKYLGHASKITYKTQVAKTDAQRNTIAIVSEGYAKLLAALEWAAPAPGWLQGAVTALNEYTDTLKAFEKQDSFYNWRGDFASSLLPEFLCRLAHERLRHEGISPLLSTRGSVVDLTISGFRDGGWAIRRKNQDLCLGLRQDSVTTAAGIVTFVVPVIAIEAKTNIDINKLNGLDFSAERLKRSFPASRYFLVTETLDFDLNKNYAGSIDEIYVLRKQRRSAARKEKAPYCADVFEDFAEAVAHHMAKADITKTHVYDRLEGGRLINV